MEALKREAIYLTVPEFLVLSSGTGLASVRGLFPEADAGIGEREVCEALFALGAAGRIVPGDGEERGLPVSHMTPETAALFKGIREAVSEVSLLRLADMAAVRYSYISENMAVETAYMEGEDRIRIRSFTPAGWVDILSEEGFFPDPAWGLERLDRRTQEKHQIRWEGFPGELSLVLISPLLDTERVPCSREAVVRILAGSLA